MKYYSKSTSEVLNELNSSISGLSNLEAKKRIDTNGYNKIDEIKKESVIKKFLNQFKNIMIIILLITSILSFFIAVFKDESFVDSVVIILIVIFNALIGLYNEIKSEKDLEALKKFETEYCKVRRNNKITQIKSADLTIGDIILLESGDKVPADCRVLSSNNFKVNESILTGEVTSIYKNNKKVKPNSTLSERSNMVYSGTHVESGKAECVVCYIGNDTEFGKISKSLTESIEEKTPLEKKIDDISKILSILVLVIILLIFVIGYNKMELMEIILLSISLAVAAIPEGLPAVITIILSTSVSKMSKNNAIIKKLSAVETLGGIDVIASDKTGTITKNEMTVKGFYESFKYSDECNNNLLLDSMILNNDAFYDNDKYVGDSIEVAFIKYATSKKIDYEYIRSIHKRINEIPFDSYRKLMSTINDYNEKKYLFVKGSNESIIQRCTKIYVDGKIKKISKKDIDKINEEVSDISNKSYRVISFAYKAIKNEKIEEDDLVYLGFVYSLDPPRDNVDKIVKECKKGGIDVLMITGDSIETAVGIAKNVNIINDESEAISGKEIQNLSFDELKEAVKKYKVFARVSPSNKIDIVRALKANGNLVAMTGDGVNDAPALKEASIGIGMGITGSDVSKNVSDMVLVDDSFLTIVTAIKEGRRIYSNIRSVVAYLLIGNIAEILIIFIGIIFGFEIFIPIQLLYINLVTDSIPAITLSFEEEQKDIMEKENKNTRRFFTSFVISRIVSSSIIKTLIVLSVFFINNHMYGIDMARTTSFITLIILELFLVYSCKSIKNNVINKNIFNNKKLNISILFMLLLLILITFTPLRNIFNLVEVSFKQFIFLFIYGFIILVFDNYFKLVLYKIFKDK